MSLVGLVPTVTLKPGMVITESVRVKPGVYSLPSENLEKPAITIKGKNITVDFSGATLKGSPKAANPAEYVGLGIAVQGENVVVKGATLRGYKVGLMARNVPGIRVTGNDMSYLWKQKLLSGLDREDTADWMSYHRNEKDEWLRYGAAIYLRGCDGFEVDHNTAVGGQNALMLTECNKGKVWNNDFSFLSSAGVLMYFSSDNKIMHNKIDWCVRGYSHGVYNRGQDSTGILIYEQSHRNVFAYNSVTHGGDGFFLWAGQSTMDNGQGGCNDNLLYGNDFSHAPTNGIEATFSRNAFVNNKILECWHGVWGGYSYETTILGNVFGMNGEAIAIEHGQDNTISHNVFHRDTTAVKLWWNDRQDPNWGYPKNRDTRSRDYVIEGNRFSHIADTVFAIDDTQGVKILSNDIERYKRAWNLTGKNERIALDGNRFYGTDFRTWAGLPGLTFGENTMATEGSRAGAPMTQVMLGSGNVVQGLDPDNADYIKRFDVPWNPWKASRADVAKFAPEPMKGGMDPFIKPGEMRGRRFILVDEWGPYDFKSPILWPRTDPEPNVKRFEVLGPEGTWRVKELRGVKELRRNGSFVDAVMEPGKATDVLIALEFVGKKDFVDRFGNTVKAGKPSVFQWSQFRMPIDWDIKWFSYTEAQEPRAHYDEFKKLITTGTPIKTLKTDKLDFDWGGELGPGLPRDKFATVAEGRFEAPGGEYDLEFTSDDGIRVWLDGKLILEDWTWHAPKVDRVRVKLGGKHHFRVEHFEIDGYAALKVKVTPRGR